MLISDSFTDNQLGWPLGLKQDHSLAVTSTIDTGRYHWVVNVVNGNSDFNLIPTQGPSLDKFHAAVNVQFVQGNEDGQSAYGLTFRHVKDDYGFFGILKSGDFLALEVHHTGIYQSLGIQTKVEAMPLAVYFPRANKTDFSFELLGWGLSTGEASYPLRALVSTFNADKGLGNFNWARYSNAQLDKVVEQALATVDDVQREKLLREAQQIAFADQAVVPLHYQINAWAARKGYSYVPRTDERTHAHSVRQQ